MPRSQFPLPAKNPVQFSLPIARKCTIFKVDCIVIGRTRELCPGGSKICDGMKGADPPPGNNVAPPYCTGD